MTRWDHVRAVITRVTFADPMPYTFHVTAEGGDDPEDAGNAGYYPTPPMIFLQASYQDADTYSPDDGATTQWTRKWHIADGMTDSQIVQTAFKLCLTSTEHRCREGFQYKGVRVYGPHYDVDDLVRLGAGKGQWRGAPGKDFKS